MIKYLTIEQVQQLISACRANSRGQNGARNALMVLMAFRHGLRVTELVNLKWSRVDLDRAELRIERAKGSRSGTHPMEPDEVQALRSLQNSSEHVFVSERGTKFTERGFRKLVEVAGAQAGLPKELCHPHALGRHAAGYHLANKGVNLRIIQDFLGHKSIANTVIYTTIAAGRYKGLFADTVGI